MHVQEHVFTHFFVFVTGRKMNNGTKQPNIPIPSMAMRKGGAGGGGCGGHGGGGGCGHGSKYLCVCFCENQPKSYISYFLARISQKSAIHIFNVVSGRQVLVAQAKNWKDAWESTTWPTLNPQWAKSSKSGHLALQQIRYLQSTQASMLLIRKLPFA